MTPAPSPVSSLAGAAWIRCVPQRSPTLPPATHTNAWVIGTTRLAVVDPASPWPEERAALDRWLDERAGAGEEVEAILLTHHHVDHVSGAEHLARRLGVPVWAHRETAALLRGRVRVDRLVEDGERVALGEVTLEALHTPGHAPGHLCFREPWSGAVVAGDMVASVGTIIIDPPEGDMVDYLASLARLRRLEPRWLLPAHGAPIDDPARLLDFYVAHRLEREARVVAALGRRQAPAPVAELVPDAYPDVPPAVYPLAARSLLAHLGKLAREGRAVEVEARWQLV